MSEPGKNEVLGWQHRTGRGAAEAVDHFWPEAQGADRNRYMARVRKWGQLEREAGSPIAPPTFTSAGNREEEADEETVQRPEADYETARLERVQFLEVMLAEALADLAWMRQARQFGRLAGQTALVVNVRDELDRAKVERGAVVQLERSPAAVAAEVEKRKKALEILAAAHARRPKEREL